MTARKIDIIRKKIRRNIISLLPGHLPDFLILGAQKAGTTSLHFYLNQHPKIVGSSPKEVRFFDRDENYKKGLDWYKKAFKDISRPLGRHLYFEATPEYMYRRTAAERIYKFNPKLKFIVLLRDPVKRAYSSWNMYRDFLVSRKRLPDILNRGYFEGMDNNLHKELYSVGRYPSFEETVNSELEKVRTNSLLEEPSFIRRGIYLPQIKRYVDLFGKDKVLVVAFKDLVGENKIQTLNRILTFVGEEESSWSFLTDEMKNTREYKESISDEISRQLQEFYKPYNDQLFEYLGYKPNW